MNESERIMAAISQNLRALRGFAEGQIEVTKVSKRVISRSARTVQCGMDMEFPEAGWQTVTGHSLVDGHAVISSKSGTIASFPAGDRVRTRNG